MSHSNEDGINGQWTCGVFIRTPTKRVVISEDLGKEPIYLKISGGRRRPIDKNKAETAVREAMEETGLRISTDELCLIASQNRKSHMYHLFTVDVTDERLGECYPIAKNGEKVHILTIDELKRRRNEFLPHHLNMLEDHKLWPA